ncbi:MAG TPA: hypothetical protein VEU07_03600, partial [Candidatus Acidoferrum sp.]|nr:hypothetical protein [Candidatus Acidoferrum sp.]
ATGAALGVGALLLVLMLLVPPAVVMSGGAFRTPVSAGLPKTPGCEGSREARALLIVPGSAVQLQESPARPPFDRSGSHVSLQDIRARQHPYEFLEVQYMWRGLGRLEGGSTLFSGYDLDRRVPLYVQSSPSLFLQLRRRAALCGEFARYGRIEWFKADGFAALGGESAHPGEGSVR